MWDGSDDELTTESENDVEEDSDKGYYSSFVLMQEQEQGPITEVEEIDVTEKKIFRLPEQYSVDIKWLFQSYRDVTAHSFDDGRPSICEVA